jgi:hypothetical protein
MDLKGAVLSGSRFAPTFPPALLGFSFFSQRSFVGSVGLAFNGDYLSIVQKPVNERDDTGGMRKDLCPI